MTTHYLAMFVCASFVFLLSAAPALAVDEDVSATAPERVELSVKGERVEMTCSMAAKMAVGQAMPLRVEITNHSEDEITYYNTGHLFNVMYSVTDRHGKDVPLTKWGRRYLRSDGEALKNSAHFLKPGESFVVEENLARYFDLSITEKCTVTIRWLSGESTNEKEKEKDTVETKLEFEVVTALPTAEEEQRIREENRRDDSPESAPEPRSESKEGEAAVEPETATVTGGTP